MRRQDTQQKKLLQGLFIAAVLILIYVGFVAKRTRTPQEKLTYEAGKVSIVKQTIKVKNYDKNYELVTLSAKPTGKHKTTRVILLHDKKLTAEIWEKTGTLKYLSGKGYEAIAVNMPGAMGTKVQGKIDQSEFLEAVVKGLDVDKDTVWVAPGIGVAWMLQFLREDEEHVKDHARAILFVAPTNIDKFENAFLTSLKGPLFYLVHGAKDKTKEAEKAKEHLKVIPNLNFAKIKGGGKTCYVCFIKNFHAVLDKVLVDIGEA